MNKVEMVKGSIGLVVSLGVGAIVKNIVKSTADNNASALTKVCVMVGGFVLTAMASKMAVNYTDIQIDDVVTQFKEMGTQQA